MVAWHHHGQVTRFGWLDICFFMFDIFCALVTMIVGIYFMDRTGENACKIAIPMFLMVNSLANISLSFLRFFYPVAGALVMLAANLILIVYGSILTFGKLASVDFLDQTKSDYCYETVFATGSNTVIFFITYFLVNILFISCRWLWTKICKCQETTSHNYSAGYIMTSMNILRNFLNSGVDAQCLPCNQPGQN